MSFIKNKALVVLLGLIAFLFTLSAQAEGLILTSPPRETAEAGQKEYGVIAAHLTKALGVKVTYEHPGNWLNYQREMRNDRYDIIFDGPHFIAWRIAHLGHEAIIRLPGQLQFILVNHKNNTEDDHPDKLIGKAICGISPPNLSTLSVLDYFRNPVRQPRIKGIKGGMPKVYKTFMDNKNTCDAAILRTTFYQKKLTDEQRANLKTLFTSKLMPNQGVSVSKRVSPSLKDKIRNELTIGAGVASTQGIIKRFAGKAKSFIPAESKEFEGYNMLLEGVIFGW